ncbi:UNVERIFIED_CONTAM: hypothetical protein Slati_0440800 [Sesamum latifolium]|uniref:Integrase catalytic domain-containing protein n=1 Tax=Sesamum latifolium TaxID=2727402 RepID=A0AAW2XWH2_9LAMI
MPMTCPLIHVPAEPLRTISTPFPFSQWAIDILGPFPVATRHHKFLLMAVDNFSKLVEAEPLARIMENEVIKFLWKNIIYRYGLPRVILSDNGDNFRDGRFKIGVLSKAFNNTSRPSLTPKPTDR